MKVDTAFRYYLATSTSTGRSVTGEEWKAKEARPEGEAIPARRPELREIEQAVKEINDHLQLVRRNLEFSVDRDTQRVVVKVIDAETGEVVRQIPPDAVLELAKFLREKESKGLLLVQQA
ncbi:MAG: flagellar protein FlaG [Methylohalobius sp.]